MSRRAKVLVLCLGNRCRSPLCAAILMQEGLDALSAGFINPGNKAPPGIRAFAHKLGIDLDDHRSQVVTWNRVDWADVIVVMNQNLVGRLREFEPYRATLVNLGQFLDPPQKSIADPNFMASSSPEFTRTLEQVVAASRALAHQLSCGATLPRVK